MDWCRWMVGAWAIALLLAPSDSRAHTVTVDGTGAEWFAVPAPVADLGRISRRPGGDGEYIWSDAGGDACGAWPSRPHDLVELRVTGDRDRLYLLAKLSGPVATSGDSVPQLQLTIDRDRLFFSGGTAFADSAGFEVAGSAAYEVLVETRFGSGQPPRLLDAWGNPLNAGATAAVTPAGVIEVSVPWSALGFAFVPASPLRLGAALFLSGADDVPLDPLAGASSRAADVVTQYGAPGSSGTTTGELSDGVLDYAIDLWFDARGEVVAPIVVNEAFLTTGTGSEWLEVVNPTQALVSLTEFKLGDEEAPGGSEAMARFPSGILLVPGQAFVVARDGAAFLGQTGQHAGAECLSSDAGTPDMLAFPVWAPRVDFDFSAAGDQVLVLDGANTVVDVLTFKNADWPGVIAYPSAPPTSSIDRLNPVWDTDDCSADFADQPDPTPGSAVMLAGVPQLGRPGMLAWAPPSPNPAGGRVTLALRVGEPAPVTVEVFDARGRRVRTLHRGPVSPGELRFEWDARDADSRPVPPGLYFVCGRTPAEANTLRLTVLR
jgi:hypothetical protein